MLRLTFALPILIVALLGCQQNSSTSSSSNTSTASSTEASKPAASAVPSTGTRTTASGLQIQDLQIGTGAEAVTGKRVWMHYTGTLTDGTKFDSSRDSGRPYELLLGNREVIAGWDEGIVGMRVGGKRRLTVPPQLAYGAQGYPPVIPSNATLIFELELMDVK